MRRAQFTALAGASLAAVSLGGCSGAAPPAIAPVPVQTYEQSRAAIAAAIARDNADPAIAKTALPRLYDHGKRTPQSVVLFHGFTNSPQQFTELGQSLFERGVNVYIPRIPYHGNADRLTRDLSKLTVPLLESASQDAYGFGSGLGDRVTALGLSLGGTMALWLAQTQAIDHAVPVSPFLMLHGLGRNVGTFAMNALHAVPDMYWWWDPHVKEGSKPDYAYPGYPTYALAEIIFFANALFARDGLKPKTGRVTLVTNVRDPAVNNGVSQQLLAHWKASGAAVAAYTQFAFTDLGEPRHDIIDPTTFPAARTLVYPKLVSIVVP